MNSTPDADPVLAGAIDLARAALREITPEHTIGEQVGHRVEAEGVVSLLFGNRMSGYPGWVWTVTLARADAEAEPTVLEVELLPADGALVAPEWVPWAVRLAEYHRQQAESGDAEESDGSELGDDDADQSADLLGIDDGDDDLDGVDDLDAADFDADGSALLHAGDVDGVDLEEAFGSAGEAEDAGGRGDDRQGHADDVTSDDDAHDEDDLHDAED